VVELGAAALARLFLNTTRCFAYPFAPGLLSPLLGPLADRWGPRTMMLLGLGCLAAGMLAAAALPFYATALVALAMAGVGKSCFDPALQALVWGLRDWHPRTV